MTAIGMIILAGSCARVAAPRTQGSYDAYPRTVRLATPCVVTVTGQSHFSQRIGRSYEMNPTEVMRNALLEGMRQTFRVVRNGDVAGADATATELLLHVDVERINYRGRDPLSGAANIVTLAVTANFENEGGVVLSKAVEGRGVQAATFDEPGDVDSVFGLAFKDVVNRLNAFVFENRALLRNE